MKLSRKMNEKHQGKILSWFFDNIRKDTVRNFLTTLQAFRDNRTLSKFQVTKKGVSASSVTDLFCRLEAKEFIKKAGTRKSKRGPLTKIQLYSLTKKGLLLGGCLLRDASLITEFLEKMRPQTKGHPLMELNLNIFKALKIDILFIYAEEFLKRTDREMDDLSLIIPQVALLFSRRILRKIQSLGLVDHWTQVFTEQFEAMPPEEKDVIFLCTKNMFEGYYLQNLTGAQLKHYISEIEKDPRHIHLMCKKCGALIKVDLNLFSWPKECEKCGAQLVSFNV